MRKRVSKSNDSKKSAKPISKCKARNSSRRKSVIQLCGGCFPNENPVEASVLNAILQSSNPLASTQDIVGAIASALEEFAYDDTTTDECNAFLTARYHLLEANRIIAKSII